MPNCLECDLSHRPSQSTIALSLQGLLWSLFALIKGWTQVAPYQQHEFWNCFWRFSYPTHPQICLSASIRLYQGPPCPQSQSSLSSTKRKQSSTLSVTQPVRHSLPAGPILVPGSHTFGQSLYLNYGISMLYANFCCIQS